TPSRWNRPSGFGGLLGVPVFASVSNRPGSGLHRPLSPEILMMEGSEDRSGNAAIAKPSTTEAPRETETRVTDVPESGETISWLPKDPRQMAAALREALSMHPHAAVVFKLGGDGNGEAPRGTILMINENLSRMFGYTEQEALGMSVQSFIVHRDLPFFRDLTLALQRSGTLDLPNTRFRTKDGRTVRCDVTGMVKQVNGHSLGFAFIEDIGERHRAQEELRASEVRHRALVRAMPDMMFRLRRDMTFLDIQMPNPDMFPVDPKQLIGTKVSDLPLPRELVQLGLTTIGRAFSTGQFERVEYEIPMPDGSTRYQEARVSPSEGGSEAMIIVRDITEIKRAEANRIAGERLAAVQLVGSSLAHDANNVLSVLSYSVQALRRSLRAQQGAPLSGEAAEDLQTASDQIERLTLMMSEFRELSTEAQSGPPFNPHTLLREAELRGILGEDIRVDLRLTHEPWLVPGPQKRISRVFQNLVTNARDAMEGRLSNRMLIETAKLTLDAARLSELSQNPASLGETKPGDFMRFRFQDNGKGIQSHELGRIFEPYFSTKTKSSSGHGGLGLALMRKFVRDAGGFMAIESAHGVGTTFDVYLPRVASNQILGEDAHAAKVLNHPVLLVGDTLEAREALQTRLRGMGFSRILHTENSAEALRWVQENPDLAAVLVDFRLGNESGLKFLEKIRGGRPNLASILWSPYDSSFFNSNTLGRFGTTLEKTSNDEVLAVRLQDLISRSLSVPAETP
ncbi:MAG: PAS domain S-box protein, partial [Deltaproteobacteria bacterium]|nr:PAS domain S-box protein [Deltaproteobacteria bacterium]